MSMEVCKKVCKFSGVHYLLPYFQFVTGIMSRLVPVCMLSTLNGIN